MFYHNDKLGFEEYRDHMLENISGVVVNPNYIEENLDFIDNLLFKLFQDYENTQSDIISFNKTIKVINIFLSVMLEQKPKLQLPEDTVKIC